MRRDRESGACSEEMTMGKMGRIFAVFNYLMPYCREDGAGLVLEEHIGKDKLECIQTAAREITVSY